MTRTIDGRMIAGAGALAALLMVARGPAAAPAKPKPAAAKPKPAAKPVENTVKGQNQLSGVNGQFGAVYTLKDKFNFTVLGAGYTIEPYVAYTPLQAGAEEKLFVIDFAIKNANPIDMTFSEDRVFTLVDDKGELFEDGAVGLQSQGLRGTDLTLRPGQGVGQVESKNPLRAGWVLPAKTRIVKIMVDRGRLDKSEEVVRYFLAGATKAEAGEAGDPKNIVQPLPEGIRDPADPTGATPLAITKAKLGQYVTSGSFGLRLDSFSYSNEALIDGMGPEEGKKFAVATFTAKSLTPRELDLFAVISTDPHPFEILDTDGERVLAREYRKAKRDEPVEHAFKLGDEYAFRVIYEMGKDTTAKSLVFAATTGRKWIVDAPAAK